MNNAKDYGGKVIVITGASSGFGRGAAIELARLGAHIILAARSDDLLEELAKECSATGVRSVAVPTDVSDTEEVQNLYQTAIASFGHIDVWINAAGVAAIGRFDQVPLEDHVQVIQTDLAGTVACSHFAMKHFRGRGKGILINVASVFGKIPGPLYASYVAAKFGVVGFCDALRQELNEEGIKDIRVCTVMPMAHSTEFFEHAANYTGHQSAPVPPTYDPKVTIDKLVSLVTEPEDEVITGWQGGIFNFLYKLMPGPIEKIMASNVEATQLKKAPAAPNTSGTVHEPNV